jgi:glutamate dehydrogenase (NAD(P)+)
MSSQTEYSFFGAVEKSFDKAAKFTNIHPGKFAGNVIDVPG